MENNWFIQMTAETLLEFAAAAEEATAAKKLLKFVTATHKAMGVETLLEFAVAAEKVIAEKVIAKKVIAKKVIAKKTPAKKETLSKKTPAKETPAKETRGRRYRVGGNIPVGSRVCCMWDCEGNPHKQPFTGIVRAVGSTWVEVAHPQQCGYPAERVCYTLGDFAARDGRILSTPS